MNLNRGLLRLYIFLTPIGWMTWWFLWDFVRVRNRLFKGGAYDFEFWGPPIIIQIVSAFIFFGLRWVIRGFQKDPVIPEK